MVGSDGLAGEVGRPTYFQLWAYAPEMDSNRLRDELLLPDVKDALQRFRDGHIASSVRDVAGRVTGGTIRSASRRMFGLDPRSALDQQTVTIQPESTRAEPCVFEVGVQRPFLGGRWWECHLRLSTDHYSQESFQDYVDRWFVTLRSVSPWVYSFGGCSWQARLAHRLPVSISDLPEDWWCRPSNPAAAWR